MIKKGKRAEKASVSLFSSGSIYRLIRSKALHGVHGKLKVMIQAIPYTKNPCYDLPSR